MEEYLQTTNTSNLTSEKPDLSKLQEKLDVEIEELTDHSKNSLEMPLQLPTDVSTVTATQQLTEEEHKESITDDTKNITSDVESILPFQQSTDISQKTNEEHQEHERQQSAIDIQTLEPSNTDVQMPFEMTTETSHSVPTKNSSEPQLQLFAESKTTELQEPDIGQPQNQTTSDTLISLSAVISEPPSEASSLVINTKSKDKQDVSSHSQQPTADGVQNQKPNPVFEEISLVQPSPEQDKKNKNTTVDEAAKGPSQPTPERSYPSTRKIRAEDNDIDVTSDTVKLVRNPRKKSAGAKFCQCQ